MALRQPLSKENFFLKIIEKKISIFFYLFTTYTHFFATIVYNYSKIEFYSSEDDLPVILSNSLIIINGIRYNDNLIKIELDKTASEGRDIAYELDKPDSSESTFSQYLQEYVEPEEEQVVLPDVE